MIYSQAMAKIPHSRRATTAAPHRTVDAAGVIIDYVACPACGNLMKVVAYPNGHQFSRCPYCNFHREFKPQSDTVPADTFGTPPSAPQQ